MESIVILLVDDDGDLLRFASAVLNAAGYTVVPAPDGSEAVRCCSGRRINLLLTDVELGPGMNGLQLAERITREDPGTRVVVMSGSPESGAMMRGMRFPFLAKPFSPSQLLEVVGAALSCGASSETGEDRTAERAS